MAKALVTYTSHVGACVFVCVILVETHSARCWSCRSDALTLRYAGTFNNDKHNVLENDHFSKWKGKCC